jgi:hypothetical protein
LNVFMRLKKMMSVAALSVLGVLTLSGCVRVEADLFIGSDGVAQRAVLTAAVDKAALAQLGAFGAIGGSDGSGDQIPSTLEEFKTLFIENGDVPGGQENCEFTESETEFVASCELAPKDFEREDLGIDNNQIVTLEGDVLTLKMEAVPVAEESSASNDLAGLGAQPTVTYRFHFPGEVISVSGDGVSIDTTDARVAVVSENDRNGSEAVVTASANEASSGLGPVVIFGILGIGGLLLVAAAVFVFRKNGESASVS